MKLSWRRPRLLLSAAVAAAALAGLAVAAAPAYAGPTYISALPGPGEILITGGGFNGFAPVRLEALAPDRSTVLSKTYVTANGSGYINDAYLTSFHGYTGNVWVAADGAPGPTAGAYTYVNLPPTLDASNPAPYCNGVVTVFGYHFQPGDGVRLTLLSGDRTKTLDTQPTTVDTSTDIPPGSGTIKLSLSGYSGPVWVFADESYPGNLTTGAYLSQAC